MANMLRILVAFGLMALGLFGLKGMVFSELSTGKDFTQYFPWAFSAGLVFVSVALAMTMADYDDTTKTVPEADSSKK